MTSPHDLVIVGAGSAGLVAAGFAARLGARVALVERARVGGDCTWTGCVPSKALLRAARVAHEVRGAARYGVEADPPRISVSGVRAHVHQAMDAVYAREHPAVLRSRGIDVIEGHASFDDARTLRVGAQLLRARRFLLCTGARPSVPRIPGLADVAFDTHETIFRLDRLPEHLLVVGAGPIGLELGLAFRRLGAEVTVVALDLLPAEDPEVRRHTASRLRRDGIRLVQAGVRAVDPDGAAFRLSTDEGTYRGDRLLIATGRMPNTEGLALERAGILGDHNGVGVDRKLRTSARHVFAAGDVTGGPQFTHYAGWQAFQAVRNALLPGSARGTTDLVPRVTFLDPEIAHVGPGEAALRARYGDRLRIIRRDLCGTDRAVTDAEPEGFLRILAEPGGRLRSATVVAARAGEVIAELALAIRHRLTVADVAGTIHAYPTWSTVVQQALADDAVEHFRTSRIGRLARRLSGL